MKVGSKFSCAYEHCNLTMLP